MRKFKNILIQFKIFKNSIRKRGFFKTINFLFNEYMFDFIYKVDTKGFVNFDKLNIIGDYSNSVPYQGSNYLLLKKFFFKYGDDVRNKTVVDLGCGKGRILIMSIKYGAKKCIGIDFAEELIEIAKKNLKKFIEKNKYKVNVVLLHENVLNYNFTGEEDVIFFYNPFNEKLLSPILQKIKKINKKIMIVYINPIHSEIFNKYLKIVDILDKELIIYSNY